MQNWDHVNGILKLLNQQPMYNNSTDFSHVRNYLLAEDSVGKMTKTEKMFVNHKVNIGVN